MSWFTRPWLLCIPLHRSGLGGFDVLQFFCVSKWHVLGVLVVVALCTYRIVRRR